MKYLYKYPQREFPYRDLLEKNRQRSREEFEYELVDTGVFEGDRYFDIFVEYAKSGPDDISVRVTTHNRGPETARVRLLPTLWFRNTWSWGDSENGKPEIRQASPGVIETSHPELGKCWLYCDGNPELLFTENETNIQRLWGQSNGSPWVKDAFHSYVISGDAGAINPACTGTKAAAHYALEIPAGGSREIRLRLTGAAVADPFNDFDAGFVQRLSEADEFYARITPTTLNEDQQRVHRQALAGMLWSKQYYFFDLERWLTEHNSHPLLETNSHGVRNAEWFHMLNSDIISMPDKWEYPWYARGTWRSTHCRCRWSISISPRNSFCSCCAACTSIRTARYRPTNGTSAMSILRCMPGPRCISTRWSGHSDAPISGSSKNHSRP